MNRVQCDSRTPWIRVKHRLRVHVVFEDGIGAAKVYGIIPIIVLPHPPRSMAAEPPGYDNYQKGTLIMSAPVTPRPASIAEADDDEHAENIVINPTDDVLTGVQRRLLRRTSSIPALDELTRRSQTQSTIRDEQSELHHRLQQQQPQQQQCPTNANSYIHHTIPEWAGNFASLPSYESVIRHRQNSLPLYNDIVAEIAASTVMNAGRRRPS
ncbi:hypothetical protein BDF22DRAFT_741876 [Syncephalis plumigaleata]|nr:hypothetical protein BDF22DRAFT_741876 [Syncephalis plumigaleata]